MFYIKVLSTAFFVSQCFFIITSQEYCLEEVFEDGSNGFFSSSCLGLYPFLVKKYSDSGLILEPEGSNGFYLTPDTSGGSCSVNDGSVLIEKGTVLSLKYFTSAETRQSCSIWIFIGTNFIDNIPIAIDNQQTWKVLEYELKQRISKIQLSCGELTDAVFAIESFSILPPDIIGCATNQPPTTTEEITTSTKEITTTTEEITTTTEEITATTAEITTTTEEITATTAEITTTTSEITATTAEITTTTEEITATTEEITTTTEEITTTTEKISTTTGSTTTTTDMSIITTTYSNMEDIYGKIDIWRTISIIAIIIALFALFYSFILTIFVLRKPNQDSTVLIEDSVSMSINSDTESGIERKPLPRLHMQHEISRTGEKVIAITAKKSI